MMQKVKQQIMLKTFLLLLLCSLTRSSISKRATRNHLQRGSSLSVEDHDSRVIMSLDNSFTCGFYGFQTNAYWFAIWFTNSKDRTVVWAANRNTPVNGHGSKLTFSRKGAMVLTDVDGTIVWQTGITSTNAERAMLLNTGNLVLKNPKGQIIWQSFDYPTDTLLPSQTLTKTKSLISALRKGSLGSGYFGLSFNSLNVLTMIYDGPEISNVYWPSPDPGYNVFAYRRTLYNSSRIAAFNDLGVFNSSDRLSFTATDMGLGIRRRLTIGPDGNLRLYSLNESSGLWSVSWQAISQPCTIHGICGRNGICIHGDKPECSCPPGYELSDIADLSKGCEPTFNITCEASASFEFSPLPHTDYYGFDLNFSSKISFESCRDICLADCRCQAFSYKLTGQGVCYAKSALFNGYQYPNILGTIYFKVPVGNKTSDPARILTGSKATCTNVTYMERYSSMYKSSGTKFKWVYPYAFALAIGVVEAMVIISGCWLFFGKNQLLASLEDGYRILSSQFRGFTYQELVKATHNFKEEIGRGGSGVVYKGVLEDERVVAVKRLVDLSEGGDHFWAEVSTIGKINHMNLVRMWGFCSQKQNKLLVYEYIENLSLDKRLFSSNFLQWKERFEVAIGVAKGLAYLHHECLEWVIHCDVKPENILLDGAFQPKIADFGLAKLSGQNSKFTRMRGTRGYMAPEWARNLPITAKVDVYSYGVVVIEIVKGVRLSNVSIQGAEEEESELMRFVKVAKELIQRKDDSWIEEVIDPRLGELFSRKQAAKLVEIGLSCVEEDKNKRPAMDSVVQLLIDCESE